MRILEPRDASGGTLDGRQEKKYGVAKAARELPVSLKKYYVRRRGRIAGPFSIMDLQRLISLGRISASDELSADKFTWRSVGSFKELSTGVSTSSATKASAALNRTRSVPPSSRDRSAAEFLPTDTYAVVPLEVEDDERRAEHAACPSPTEGPLSFDGSSEEAFLLARSSFTVRLALGLTWSVYKQHAGTLLVAPFVGLWRILEANTWALLLIAVMLPAIMLYWFFSSAIPAGFKSEQAELAISQSALYVLLKVARVVEIVVIGLCIIFRAGVRFMGVIALRTARVESDDVLAAFTMWPTLLLIDCFRGLLLLGYAVLSLPVWFVAFISRSAPLAVFIAVGFWALIMRLRFAELVCLDDGLGAWTALRRSWILTSPFIGKLLSFYVLVHFLVLLAAGVVVIPFVVLPLVVYSSLGWTPWTFVLGIHIFFALAVTVLPPFIVCADAAAYCLVAPDSNRRTGNDPEKVSG